MTYQGSRSTHHLSFPVVLTTVAWALELLLILQECSGSDVQDQLARELSALIFARTSLRMQAGAQTLEKWCLCKDERKLTLFHGTTHPKCVHTAFNPYFSIWFSSVTIRYVASDCITMSEVRRSETQAWVFAVHKGHLETLNQVVVASWVCFQPL